MRKNLNEQGYALLIVLFLIVFIMVVSAVFIRGTLGNAKQEIKVDESHLTVMAAEAGVDYIIQALANEYYLKKDELDNLARNLIQATPNDKKIDYNSIHQELSGQLIDYLQQRIDEINNETERVPQIFVDKYSYQFEKMNLTRSGDRQITFSGKSKGIAITGGKEVTIDFKQVFLIPDYENAKRESESLGNPIDMTSFYPSDVGVDVCKSDDLRNKKCKVGNGIVLKRIWNNSTVYFPFSYSQPNGNLDIRSSTVYSNGGMVVSNFNQFENSAVSVNGSLEVRSNMNGVKNSTLKVSGSFKSLMNVKMEKSSFYIAGAFHAVKDFDINNNSLVCVGGNISFDGALNISNGSKLFYVVEENKNNQKLTGLRNAVGVSSSEIWKKCGAVESTEEVQWEKPQTKDVTYY